MKRRDMLAQIMAEGAGQSTKTALEYLGMLEAKHPDITARLDEAVPVNELEEVMRELRENKAGVKAMFDEGIPRFLAKMLGRTPGSQN